MFHFSPVTINLASLLQEGRGWQVFFGVQRDFGKNFKKQVNEHKIIDFIHLNFSIHLINEECLVGKFNSRAVRMESSNLFFNAASRSR